MKEKTDEGTQQQGSCPCRYGEGIETGEAIEEEPGRQPSIQEDWLAVETHRSPWESWPLSPNLVPSAECRQGLLVLPLLRGARPSQ